MRDIADHIDAGKSSSRAVAVQDKAKPKAQVPVHDSYYNRLMGLKGILALNGELYPASTYGVVAKDVRVVLVEDHSAFSEYVYDRRTGSMYTRSS